RIALLDLRRGNNWLPSRASRAAVTVRVSSASTLDVTATPIPSQPRLQTVSRIEKDHRARAKRLVYSLHDEFQVREDQRGICHFRDRYNRSRPGRLIRGNCPEHFPTLNTKRQWESRIRPGRDRGSSLAQLSMVSPEPLAADLS